MLVAEAEAEGADPSEFQGDEAQMSDDSQPVPPMGGFTPLSFEELMREYENNPQAKKPIRKKKPEIVQPSPTKKRIAEESTITSPMLKATPDRGESRKSVQNKKKLTPGTSQTPVVPTIKGQFPPIGLHAVESEGDFQVWFSWAKDVWRGINRERKNLAPHKEPGSTNTSNKGGEGKTKASPAHFSAASKKKKTRLKYPIEDCEVEGWEDGKNMAGASFDFGGLPGEHVPVMLLAWDFLGLFGSLLDVPSLTLEEILTGIMANGPSHAVNSICAALLRAILLPYCASARGAYVWSAMVRAEQAGLVVNSLTWQHHLRQWLQEQGERKTGVNVVPSELRSKYQVIAEALDNPPPSATISAPPSPSSSSSSSSSFASTTSPAGDSGLATFFDLALADRVWVVSQLCEYAFCAPLMRKYLDKGVIELENARKATYRDRMLSGQNLKVAERNIPEVCAALNKMVGTVVQSRGQREDKKDYNAKSYNALLVRRAVGEAREKFRLEVDELARRMEKVAADYPMRSRPLGRDRRFNRFWILGGDKRVLFVESVEASGQVKWGYYDTAESYLQLIKSLDDRGMREKALLEALKKTRFTWQRGLVWDREEAVTFSQWRCVDRHLPDEGFDARFVEKGGFDLVRLRASLVLELAEDEGDTRPLGVSKCSLCQDSVQQDEVHCFRCHRTMPLAHKARFDAHSPECEDAYGHADGTGPLGPGKKQAGAGGKTVPVGMLRPISRELAVSSSSAGQIKKMASAAAAAALGVGLPPPSQSPIPAPPPKSRRNRKRIGGDQESEAAASASGKSNEERSAEEEAEEEERIKTIVARNSEKPSLVDVSEEFRALKGMLMDVEAAIPMEAVRPNARANMADRREWIARVKLETTLSGISALTRELGVVNITRQHVLKGDWLKSWFSLERWGKQLEGIRSLAQLATLLFQIDRALTYTETEYTEAKKSGQSGHARKERDREREKEREEEDEGRNADDDSQASGHESDEEQAGERDEKAEKAEKAETSSDDDKGEGRVPCDVCGRGLGSEDSGVPLATCVATVSGECTRQAHAACAKQALKKKTPDGWKCCKCAPSSKAASAAAKKAILKRAKDAAAAVAAGRPPSARPTAGTGGRRSCKFPKLTIVSAWRRPFAVPKQYIDMVQSGNARGPSQKGEKRKADSGSSSSSSSGSSSSDDEEEEEQGSDGKEKEKPEGDGGEETSEDEQASKRARKSQLQGRPAKPANAEEGVSADLLCRVCYRETLVDQPDAPPAPSKTCISCAKCGIKVHPTCYGATGSFEGWMCDPCRVESESGSVERSCVLCSVDGGALKPVSGPVPSDQTGKLNWAHISCAIWIPHVTFSTPARTEVCSIDKVHTKRWQLVCIVCGAAGRGACLQCMAKGCKTAFHAECALLAHAGAKERREAEEKQWHLVGPKQMFCPNHTTTLN